jgi:anti-sigma regulatory factor (Ser/Thr protein kinase)
MPQLACPQRDTMTRHPPPTLPHEVTAGIRLAAMASAPFWARRHAQDVLGKWRAPGETIETAELLVSELVTNAAKLPSPGIIDVMLRYCPGRHLVIEVSDSDPHPPTPADPDVNSESGRGLMLVQALSGEWSYYFLASGGKTVYCVITPPPGAGRPLVHPPGSRGGHDTPHPGTGAALAVKPDAS